MHEYGRGCFFLLLGLFTVAGLLLCTDKVKRRRSLIIFTMSLFSMLGFFRMESVSSEGSLSELFGESIAGISATGTISDISISDEQYQIVLENPIIYFENNKAVPYYAEGIKVYCDSCSSGFGDTVKVSGKFSPCKRASNEGQYDSLTANKLKGIEGFIYADSINTTAVGEGIVFTVRKWLYDLAVSFRMGIEAMFPEREAGILDAMLTGDKGNLDADIRELYSKVGIAHILSISGLHITLLGMGIFGLMMRLSHSLRLSVFSSLIIIFLYGILTGFSISTERAFIMLFCMLAAKIAGKPYDGQSAAALAAVIILFKEPRYIFDAGFQMSFFAVFGIFAGNEILREAEIKNPLLRYIAPGLSAQLAVLPVILRTYYSFSPYSIIANLVLLPLMSVLILSGLVSGLFGMFFVGNGSMLIMNIGRLCGGPAYYILKIYEKASGLLLKLPAGNVVTGCPDILKVLIYYFIYFAVVYYAVCRRPLWSLTLAGATGKVKERQKKRIFAIVSFMVLAMSALLLKRRGDREMYAAFLDVGQGQCIYVENGKRRYLIDGGSTSSTDIGKYVISPYLMYQGIDELDACIVTHTDSDHVNGIRQLIKEGNVVCKKVILASNIDGTDSFASFLSEENINIEHVSSGDNIDGLFYILSPGEKYIFTDDNEGSLVTELIYDDFSMLITGDSGFEAEQIYVENINEGKLNAGVNVLQVPHHGSRYSSSEYMLNSIKPQLSVISCSKNNTYGHPAPETLERLEYVGTQVLKTYEAGRIAIQYDSYSKNIAIKTYHAEPE